MSINMLKEVGVDGAMAGAAMLSRPAEEYENDEKVEGLWAMKAFEHSEVYFNLISSLDPKILKLTPHDDLIYTKFREEFPDFKVDVIDINSLKSAEAKEKWRPYCNHFEKIVQDFNFGTLLRLNCNAEYTEENSIIATRIQFYAIELARNLEGHNDDIRKLFKPKPRQKAIEREENLLSSFTNSLKIFTKKKSEDCKIYRSSLSKKSMSDFSLYSKDGPEDICKDLLQSQILPLKLSSAVMKNKRLHINLDRKDAFYATIQTILKTKKNFGRKPRRNKNILVFKMLSYDTSGLDDLRTKLVVDVSGNLLDFCGFKVIYDSNEKREDTNDVDKLKLELKLVANAESSEYKYDPSEDDGFFANESGNDSLLIDGKKYLKCRRKSAESQFNYDSNVNILPVTVNEENSTIFNYVVQIMNLQAKSKSDLLLVSRPQTEFMLHQVLLLIEILVEEVMKTTTIMQGAVHSNNIEVEYGSEDKYMSRRLETIYMEMLHKYKDKMSVEFWKVLAQNLAKACITFDFLSTKISSPLKLEMGKSNSSGPKGKFVMYNFARLAMILSKFNENTKTGYYPKMPKIEQIDFNQLKHQIEWKILFNYLLYFPTLIEEICETVDYSKLKIHKLSHFLLSMSEDLSEYYSKVHILIEPKCHLLPTLFARLYLITAAKQVMANALKLLNIPEINEM